MILPKEYSIAEEISKAAIKGVTVITDDQLLHLAAAGVLRTDIEVEAFDDMEKGKCARVRYLADEVDRLDH